MTNLVGQVKCSFSTYCITTPFGCYFDSGSLATIHALLKTICWYTAALSWGKQLLANDELTGLVGRPKMVSSMFANVPLRFAGQFLCSYSTLPLYALVTQVLCHEVIIRFLVISQIYCFSSRINFGGTKMNKLIYVNIYCIMQV